MKCIHRFGIPHVMGVTDAGPFFLSKNRPDLIKQMDSIPELTRIEPNKRMWYLIPEMYLSISVVKDTFIGETAYIIGKGPTLDYLTLDDFCDPGVVLCCNNSVHHILKLDLPYPVKLVQCDPEAGTINVPKEVDVYTTINCTSKYAGTNNTIYYGCNNEFKTYDLFPVGCFAVAVAKILGCSSLNLMAFDGAFGNNCNYAKAIGYKSSEHSKYSDPSRFLGHGPRILKCIADMPYVITLKTGNEESSVDTPQQ